MGGTMPRSHRRQGKVSMSDRVQQAASQIDIKEGETISLQFEQDRAHSPSGGSGDKHGDAYAVTNKGGGRYDVSKMRTDEKKK
jgi:predicted transcriptional regulator